MFLKLDLSVHFVCMDLNEFRLQGWGHWEGKDGKSLVLLLQEELE